MLPLIDLIVVLNILDIPTNISLPHFYYNTHQVRWKCAWDVLLIKGWVLWLPELGT